MGKSKTGWGVDRIVLDIEIDKKITKAVNKLRKEIYTNAFAESDPHGHKRYHRKMISDQRHREEISWGLKDRLIEKVILFVGAIAGIGAVVLITQYISNH
jgi:hypothetical protein